MLALGHRFLANLIEAGDVARIQSRIVGRLHLALLAVALVEVTAAIRARNDFAALDGRRRTTEAGARLVAVHEFVAQPELERRAGESARVEEADGEGNGARLAEIQRQSYRLAAPRAAGERSTQL